VKRKAVTVPNFTVVIPEYKWTFLICSNYNAVLNTTSESM